MSAPAFYYHPCLKCNAAGSSICPICGGRGKTTTMMGFSSKQCVKCRGKRFLRCDACAGVGKFKVYNLPDLLAGIKMEHTAEYYKAVCERLARMTNVIIDTVDYHSIKFSEGNSDLLKMDGVSTLYLKPAGWKMEGFVNNLHVAPAQFIKSKLNALATDTAHYTRFIGRLLEVKALPPPSLGCHYSVQCYYLDLLDPSEQSPESTI